MKRIAWVVVIASVSIGTILFASALVSANEPINTGPSFGPIATAATATNTPIPPPPGTIPPTPAPREPQGTPNPVVGVPGITPTLLGVGPNDPTFRAADVTAYVRNVGLRAPRAEAVGPIVVANVEFMTSGQARERLNTTIDGQDANLVCVVTITGTFNAGGPAGRYSAQGHSGTLVFNAKTGNLLLEQVATR